MVEAGELTIKGNLEDEGMDSGFERLSNNMSDLENQANQANASLNMLGGTTSKILKTFVGLGIAGLTAMTMLAVKSPVLAGTMAKMEVETMKLSNTLGRQLKPIFDEIANNLLPTINNAFANSESMKDFTDVMTNLVGALAALIELDWEELKKRLGLIGHTQLGIDEEKLTETQKQLGSKSEWAETVEGYRAWKEPGRYSEWDYAKGKPIGGLAMVGMQAVVDLFQWIAGSNNEVERKLISADGIPRG